MIWFTGMEELDFLDYLDGVCFLEISFFGVFGLSNLLILGILISASDTYDYDFM